MKVLIVVTHLLGTGHLARALVLARAFRDAGHPVTLVSGGFPAPHLDTKGVNFVQLPPLRSDGVNFTRLLDAEGASVTDLYMESRRSHLLRALDESCPDAIITELFPFGRRVLAPEFMVLLDKAKAMSPAPVICSSVRDILAPPSKPEKARTTSDIVAHSYDAVLVHSDPDVTPLETSWPISDDVAQKLRYTGFVAAAPAGPHPEELGKGRILVSSGGGSVGAPIYDCVLASAMRTPDWHWHLLVGGADKNDQIADLKRRAGSNVTIEPASTAFRQMLFHARASVSQCGYNTALDMLQAGTPAVFIPFDDGSEVEQTLRAQRLATMQGIEVVETASLSADRLTRSLQNVMASKRRAPRTEGLHGAERSVEIVAELVKTR